MATEEQLSGTSLQVLGGDGPFRAGQKLTISNRTVSELAFEVSEDFVGSPVGDIILTIRKVSNDSVLATKVWGDASALSGAREWIEVTFDSAVYVNEEVRILCEYYGNDENNRFKIRFENSDVKASEHFTRWVTDYSSDNTDRDFIYKYTYTAGAYPTVTIQAVTNIVTTTARAHGDVTNLGTPVHSQHGHCWVIGSEPDVNDSKTELGVKSSTGAFVSELTGLTGGQTYRVRAYITSPAGTFYSSELSFVAGTAGAQSYPSEAITRVTNLIHRYNRKEGVYELEMSLGEVTSDFGLPEWASSPKALATNQEWEENMKRIIDDVRSYGIIPTPGQAPEPIGLGPLGRAAREEQMFVAPEPAPRQPSISERATQFTFPGFTAPGVPVSTAKVTEERPVTDVQPGILERTARMFRLRRARPVSIEEEKAKFARLRETPKPKPVGITESIKRLMRFR